jgi:tetratricopeptide (TPR) repeat protein
MYDEALSHLQAGRLAEATEACRAVLNRRPRDYQALYLLGLVRLAEGATDEAIFFLTAALGAAPGETPDILPTLNALGTTLLAGRKIEAALDCYQRALAIQPNDAATLHNYGNALYAAERHDEAIQAYRRALEVDPERTESHTQLGGVLRATRQAARAEAQYREALRIRPDDAESLSGLGNAVLDLDRHQDAIDCYERVLAIAPGHGAAHLGMGAALAGLNRHAEALGHYRKAAAISPESHYVRYNRSLSLLTTGAFAEGWAMHEARLDISGWRSRFMLRDGSALWRGERDIAGKTILLQAEQGLGDTIQFVRYAPLVAERGARVLLGVQPTLKALLTDFPGTQGVIAPGEIVPAIDLQCPLMSLPLAFGTDLASIPADIPYLRADPTLVARWEKRLAARTSPRIGLALSGNPTYGKDRSRSMALRDLTLLLRDPAFAFHLVQNELRPDDAKALAEFPALAATGLGITDFADTAALVSLMDIVISVDTSIAHLAGALGRPTWILLAHSGDWRWLLDRDDTPWYPTARLFRQRVPCDWKCVVERVVAALQHHRFC